MNNNNKIEKIIYSYAKNLMDANGNFNCFNCKNCKNCRNCSNCNGCNNCDSCNKCAGCNGCNSCYMCNDCNGCNSCNNCNGCNGCESCNKCDCCSQCNSCYKCSNCSNCSSCTNVNDKVSGINENGNTKTSTGPTSNSEVTNNGATTAVVHFKCEYKDKDGSTATIDSWGNICSVGANVIYTDNLNYIITSSNGKVTVRQGIVSIEGSGNTFTHSILNHK